MRKHRSGLSSTSLAAALFVLGTTGVCAAAPGAIASSPANVSSITLPAAGVQIAQADAAGPHHPQPCCEGAEQPCCRAAKAPHGNAYNDEYVFGLTRGIADSTLHPAVKILVFPMTVPLDFALLPFELIGGMF